MTFDEMLADHAALSGDMQRSQEAMKIALLTIEKIKVELTYLRRMKYDRFSGRIQRVDATH
jgi:transposase